MSYMSFAAEKLGRIKSFVSDVLRWSYTIEGHEFWSDVETRLVDHKSRARETENCGIPGNIKHQPLHHNRVGKWWFDGYNETDAKKAAAQAADDLHAAMGWSSTPEGHEYWSTVKQAFTRYSRLSGADIHASKVPDPIITSTQSRKTLLLCEQKRE